MPDPGLTYHPVVRDAPDIIRACSPDRLLLVGGAVPEGFEAADRVRRSSGPGGELPVGVYRFIEGTTSSVMVVTSGA